MEGPLSFTIKICQKLNIIKNTHTHTKWLNSSQVLRGVFSLLILAVRKISKCQSLRTGTQ